MLEVDHHGIDSERFLLPISSCYSWLFHCLFETYSFFILETLLTSNIVHRNWSDLVCACTHRRGADQGDVEILDLEMRET